MATSVTTGALYGSANYGSAEYGVTDTTITLGVGDSVSATTSVSTPDVFIVNARITEGVEGTGVVNAGYTDKYNGFYVSTNYVNSYYGEGVYGISRYGDTSSWTEVEVPEVVGTGNVTGVSVSAASETSLTVSVFAEIITDAEATVGDEVTVTAGATPTPSGVEGTGELGTITQKTVNRVPVSGVEGTSEITTTDITADCNLSLSGVSGTLAVEDVEATAGSINVVSGVSATGEVEEDEVVRNNAIPTLSGVTATNSPGNVTISTTTVIFNSANKDHDRTTYVEPDKPRIVYVRAA